MPGSATALVLTVLLSLGLFQRQQILAQPGTLSKPSIWADPDPMITRRCPVTIRCQGSPQGDRYHLLKDGYYFWNMTLLNSRERGASYTIQSMNSDHAGQYQCRYNSSNGWSPLSEPLHLTMTGIYSPPPLSAHPGSVVSSGGKVTLICSSVYSFQTFYLLKEGRVPVVQHMKSQYSMGKFEAHFLVDPVNPSRGGTYKCYGSYDSNPHVWSKASNPVDLLVTGVHTKPSLSAHPGALVLLGASLTLQCGSEAGFDRFALTKDEQLSGPRNLDAQHSSNFTLSPVQDTHRGQYRCYGGYNLSYEWSAPSDRLDILVAGAYEKPSLSAHLGPSVTSGENVALQCLSAGSLNTFHLFKEGFLAPLQHLYLLGIPGPIQATFILGPVTSAHGGSYRCYTSHSNSPYLLSQPSDPLELVVSGAYGKPSLSAHPGPSVTSGENVALQCLSAGSFNTFHLFKEGFVAPLQQLPWSGIPGPIQATFILGPVTSAHGGTYRCYTSHTVFHNLLSQPSDPLELVVSEQTFPPPAREGSMTSLVILSIICLSTITLSTITLSTTGLSIIGLSIISLSTIRLYSIRLYHQTLHQRLYSIRLSTIRLSTNSLSTIGLSTNSLSTIGLSTSGLYTS
ncbi:PREDICTED: leukocyte immunoglobulin-like receptor subfamily B member 1-like [Chrysochloris asiatica]|uniref:Leukocyte immunoglobulin-like receptor subfamily B member 1-like n=1 Tax=Chrysochloris asiatica TaxID=185453 RepID=A0A9B0TP65_CHRAS|nr:PREDICTED: leukocyte immunoglobulin-like receptor subfamily B member 1-like [Chrysochloris asiatica]